MKNKQEEHVPNMSGSFQVVNEERKKDIKELKSNELDDEQMPSRGAGNPIINKLYGFIHFFSRGVDFHL